MGGRPCRGAVINFGRPRHPALSVTLQGQEASRRNCPRYKGTSNFNDEVYYSIVNPPKGHSHRSTNRQPHRNHLMVLLAHAVVPPLNL